MRYLIILLFSFSAFGQLDPVGNVVYTDIQIQKATNSFANPTTTYPATDSRVHNATASINTGAEQFRSDMAGSGVDRGAFDFFFNGVNGEIPKGADSRAPFETNWPSNGKPAASGRNIHFAAIKALATNDQTLALHVLTGIHQRAIDDNLDFSNGGAQREAGEPSRTNATYGTTVRYEYTEYAGWETPGNTSPFFPLAAKMKQYAISYSLIYELVKNTTQYSNQSSAINYWFKDANDFFKRSTEVLLSEWLGSNWRAFQRDWIRPTNVFNSIPAYNANGTTLYTTSDGAAQGITNRSVDTASYVAFYGLLFDDANSRSLFYDMFRAMMAVAVYPDGTFHEHYRWDANPDYVWTHFIHWFAEAHCHEVAVERGYLPSNERGKYYDYSTSIGTNELYNGYTPTSTSGGTKSLQLMLQNLGRYYRDAATGGYTGVRGRLSGGNVIPYTTSLKSNLPISIYLSYNPSANDLQDFRVFASSAGYTGGTNPEQQQNGMAPHSYGIGFGAGAALGGDLVFDGTNAFSGTVNPPPTNPGTTRAKVYRKFFNLY